MWRRGVVLGLILAAPIAAQSTFTGQTFMNMNSVDRGVYAAGFLDGIKAFSLLAMSDPDPEGILPSDPKALARYRESMQARFMADSLALDKRLDWLWKCLDGVSAGQVASVIEARIVAYPEERAAGLYDVSAQALDNACRRYR